jgi:multiple sugar transport system permease protein
MILALSTKTRKVWFRWFIYSMLILVAAFVIFPIAWMISTSLKTEQEALAIPPTWLPQKLTAFGFQYMWNNKPFLRFIFNSLLTAGPTAILSTLFGGLAAYAVSRFRFGYRRTFMLTVLCTQMIPGVLLIGPYFKVLSFFGLYNTHIGLILAYTAVSLPFCTWMLKGYFDSIPKELDEAALVDGCSKISALFKVILPLSFPGMVATGVFGFLLGWGDLLWALCLTSSESMSTVTLAISNFGGELRVVWPAKMAAALIACVPSVFFYSFLQKYIVGGMTKGSVKG